MAIFPVMHSLILAYIFSNPLTLISFVKNTGDLFVSAAALAVWGESIAASPLNVIAVLFRKVRRGIWFSMFVSLSVGSQLQYFYPDQRPVSFSMASGYQ
jgi:hypothetical protein